MKSFIADNLPQGLINTGLHTVYWQKRNRIKRLLASTEDQVTYLGLKDLEAINHQFRPPAQYKYTLEALTQRGKKRSSDIVNMIRPAGRVKRSLEVGAKDGVVSHFLSQDHGITATCIDLEPEPEEGFSYEGVDFVKGSVVKMPFEDNQFDLAFSYNSFEHIDRPKEGLLEILRVMKPGGLIYLDFGPLYFSPKGLHAYNRIFVPYCQLLFEHSTLEAYCARHSLAPLRYKIDQGLNGWSIEQYRDLWKDISSVASIDTYHELPMYKHLDVVAKYPQCFKSKFDSFDNLLVTQIRMQIRKK